MVLRRLARAIAWLRKGNRMRIWSLRISVLSRTESEIANCLRGAHFREEFDRIQCRKTLGDTLLDGCILQVTSSNDNIICWRGSAPSSVLVITSACLVSFNLHVLPSNREQVHQRYKYLSLYQAVQTFFVGFAASQTDQKVQGEAEAEAVLSPWSQKNEVKACRETSVRTNRNRFSDSHTPLVDGLVLNSAGHQNLVIIPL